MVRNEVFLFREVYGGSSSRSGSATEVSANITFKLSSLLGFCHHSPLHSSCCASDADVSPV